MRKITINLLIAIILSNNLIAQKTVSTFNVHNNKYGIIERNYEGYNTLDINNVSAGYLNLGDMFWDLSNPQYEVPKGSGKHSIFAGSLWIGGLDASEQLHGAFMKHRDNGYDFFPGPLKIAGDIATTDETNADKYDNIWKINRYEIENFIYHFAQGDVDNGTYTIPSVIENWPAHGDEGYSHNLAPFIDVNEDGIYNPNDGDYPDIKGDEMLWWVFNDNLAEHTETGSKPMGIEVHASAYANLYENAPNDSIDVINYTTFLNFKVYNRSDTTYNDVYLGFWTDIDLGDAFDDFIGSHVGLNSFYAYNGQNEDGDGNGNSYGENPPAQSVTFLNAPENDGNDQIMSKFMYFNNSLGDNGDPETDIDHYNYLKGIWKDGTSMTYGGIGYMDGELECDYMFPGNSDPTGIGTGGIIQEPWSEITEFNEPDDRRGVGSVGPFTLEAGEMIEFDIAFVWSRGNDGPMSSVEKLFNDIENVIDWYNNDNLPTNYEFAVGVQKANNKQSEQIHIFPNPVKDQVYAEFYSSEIKPIRYKIYSLTGERIITGAIIGGKKQAIDVSYLVPGTYILELSDKEKAVSEKFVKK